MKPIIDNIPYKKHVTLIFFAACFTIHSFSQTLIKKLEIKDFPQYWERYPYEALDYQGQVGYISHNPVVRLSENDFVCMYHPKAHMDKARVLIKYDILLQELWKTEFDLMSEEEIFHMYKRDSSLIMLSTYHDKNLDQYVGLAREVSLNSGKIKQDHMLVRVDYKQGRDIMFAISPGEDYFVLYHYTNRENKKRARIYYDFIQSDETLGHRSTRVDGIAFKVFDSSLHEVSADTMDIPMAQDKKTFSIGSLIDDEGKVYSMVFESPNTIHLNQWDGEKRTQKKLIYRHFPDIWYEEDLYATHMPPALGNDNNLFIAISNRQKVRGNWHTFGFKVLEFDFKRMEIDSVRKINTNATVHVQTSKERQAFGLRPEKIFDRYLVREIHPLADGSLWLITQKYNQDQILAGRSPQVAGNSIVHNLEEILMFEFSPEKEFEKLVVVPTVQKTQGIEMQAGQFYTKHYDPGQNRFQFITHEKDGEKRNRPERTFYREVDLFTGEVSERKMLFEGRRSMQLYFKPYTTWLNSEIIGMMVEDGYQNRTYLVTVNLLGEKLDRKQKKLEKKKWKEEQKRKDGNSK